MAEGTGTTDVTLTLTLKRRGAVSGGDVTVGKLMKHGQGALRCGLIYLLSILNEFLPVKTQFRVFRASGLP